MIMIDVMSACIIYNCILTPDTQAMPDVCTLQSAAKDDQRFC